MKEKLAAFLLMWIVVSCLLCCWQFDLVEAISYEITHFSDYRGQYPTLSIWKETLGQLAGS